MAVRCAYLILGIAMAVFVDSLYSNAGMHTPVSAGDGVIPSLWGWNRVGASPTERTVRLVIRAMLGFLGMMLLWVSKSGPRRSCLALRTNKGWMESEGEGDVYEEWIIGQREKSKTPQKSLDIGL